MAPQKSKRTDTSKVAAPGKKARVAAPATAHVPEGPFAQELAPILGVLAASELPESCCEIFSIALPLCVGVTPQDRHHYQTKLLDLASSSLKRLEAARLAALAGAEARAESFRSEGLVATAEADAARHLADAKQQESDAKGAEAKELAGEVAAAKLALDAEAARKEAFYAGKASLVAEREDFQKFLDTVWEPLKVTVWPWNASRKRDRALAELADKLTPLALDESLVDALLAAMRLKPEQRQGFAQRAVGFTEDALARHAAALAARVAGTGAEEDERERSVAEAGAKLAECQHRHAEKDKECDELQNSWAELQTGADRARTAAEACDAETQAALAAVEACKADRDAAVAVSASLAALRDAPAREEQPAIAPQQWGQPVCAIAPEAPEAPGAEEASAHLEGAPAMEVEVPAVAACA